MQPNNNEHISELRTPKTADRNTTEGHDPSTRKRPITSASPNLLIVEKTTGSFHEKIASQLTGMKQRLGRPEADLKYYDTTTH